MFAAASNKDELLEVFDSKLQYIRRNAPRLCARTASRAPAAVGQDGTASSATKQAPTASATSLKQRGNSGSASSPSKRADQKNQGKGSSVGPVAHLVNSFEEIGWLDPLPGEPSGAAEGANLAQTAFD